MASDDDFEDLSGGSESECDVSGAQASHSADEGEEGEVPTQALASQLFDEGFISDEEARKMPSISTLDPSHVAELHRSTTVLTSQPTIVEEPFALEEERSLKRLRTNSFGQERSPESFAFLSAACSAFKDLSNNHLFWCQLKLSSSSSSSSSSSPSSSASSSFVPSTSSSSLADESAVRLGVGRRFEVEMELADGFEVVEDEADKRESFVWDGRNASLSFLAKFRKLPKSLSPIVNQVSGAQEKDNVSQLDGASLAPTSACRLWLREQKEPTEKKEGERVEEDEERRALALIHVGHPKELEVCGGSGGDGDGDGDDEDNGDKDGEKDGKGDSGDKDWNENSPKQKEDMDLDTSMEDETAPVEKKENMNVNAKHTANETIEKTVPAEIPTLPSAQFSAFSPEIESGTDFMVSVWVHRPEEFDAIKSLEEKEGRTKFHVKQGLVLTPGVKIDMKVQSHSKQLEPMMEEDSIAKWDGIRANMSLLVSCTEETLAGRSCFVVLRLTADEKDFGKLPVMVNVKKKEETAKIDVFLYPPRSPHIFVSYRRIHGDLARCIKLYLEQSFHYQVFLDNCPDSGLTAGDFQRQLEGNLNTAAVFIPVLTPPPSGEDERRKSLSYLGCVKHSAATGQVDWCYRELQLALKAFEEHAKVVIPVFRGVDLGVELKDLPPDIARLGSLQCIKIVEEYFKEAISHVHKGIQTNLRAFQQNGRYMYGPHGNIL